MAMEGPGKLDAELEDAISSLGSLTPSALFSTRLERSLQQAKYLQGDSWNRAVAAAIDMASGCPGEDLAHEVRADGTDSSSRNAGADCSFLWGSRWLCEPGSCYTGRRHTR